MLWNLRTDSKFVNNKSVAAQTNCGDEKVGVKGQQHDEEQQIQAKLAAGAHQGHMTTHISKCLHGSAIAKPAESCTQLPFWGAILLKGSKIGPPNIWGTNLKLFF